MDIGPWTLDYFNMHPIRNFCIVEAAIGYDSLSTNIALIAGDGSKLPDPASEGNFNLVWFNFSDYKNPSDDPYREIVKVTSKNNDILSVERGQENIAATLKNLPGKIYKLILTLTKEAYDEIIPGYHGSIASITDGNLPPALLGENAVDFQFNRTDPNQSASGSCSFIAGGNSNCASGGCAFTCNSHNTASGENSSAIGMSNAASGRQSFVSGRSNIAAGDYSAASGYGAKTRFPGQLARANCCNTTVGDAQISSLILKASTTDDVPAELSLNAGGKLILENNTSYLFHGFILGKNGNILSAGYEVKGLIIRAAGTGSVQLLGNPIVNSISDVSSACNINILADTVNGALQIMVTGAAGMTIRWICLLDWVELK